MEELNTCAQSGKFLNRTAQSSDELNRSAQSGDSENSRDRDYIERLRAQLERDLADDPDAHKRADRLHKKGRADAIPPLVRDGAVWLVGRTYKIDGRLYECRKVKKNDVTLRLLPGRKAVEYERPKGDG